MLFSLTPFLNPNISCNSGISSGFTSYVSDEAIIRMIGVKGYFSNVIPGISERIKKDNNEINSIIRLYKLQQDRELIIFYLQKLSKFSEPELEDIRVKFYELLKEIDQPLEQAKKYV